MNTIRVKQLGLAAYIKMEGATLVGIQDREFVFESHTTLEDWRLKYNNSCCMHHDSLVCELRHHLKG